MTQRYRHGRDNKLHVWQLKQEDESTFSTILPIEDALSDRKQPWLLHSLTVNALNFCSFAMTPEMCTQASESTGPVPTERILVATPGVQDGFVNVTSLPEEERVATIPTPRDVKTGMVMAIRLLHFNVELIVLAGYESGHVATWRRNPTTRQWHTIYVHKSHSQPVLSLDVAPDLECFYTSSADAIVARHPLQSGTLETKDVQTKHAGQQSLTVRSDEKIFATAGWDGRLRVYSAKTMKELAVLKWHKEGCYALAFAYVSTSDATNDEDNATNGSLTIRDLTVSEQRTARAKSTHWLAAGSKDGKVSLWNIY